MNEMKKWMSSVTGFVTFSFLSIVVLSWVAICGLRQLSNQQRQIDQLSSSMAIVITYDKTAETEAYYYNKLPRGEYIPQFVNFSEREVVAAKPGQGRHYVYIFDAPTDVLVSLHQNEVKSLP